MKQTAVEWLDRWFRDNPEATHEEGNNALEQAKEMERFQLIDAQSYAISNADMTNNRGYFDCDKWYDETYGSKGSDETLKENHIVDSNEMVSSQTEISDEEIHKAATNYSSLYYEFRAGATWYREQLKSRQ